VDVFTHDDDFSRYVEFVGEMNGKDGLLCRRVLYPEYVDDESGERYPAQWVYEARWKGAVPMRTWTFDADLGAMWLEADEAERSVLSHVVHEELRA
jgi:hypothetical protein